MPGVLVDLGCFTVASAPGHEILGPWEQSLAGQCCFASERTPRGPASRLPHSSLARHFLEHCCCWCCSRCIHSASMSLRVGACHSVAARVATPEGLEHILTESQHSSRLPPLFTKALETLGNAWPALGATSSRSLAQSLGMQGAWALTVGLGERQPSSCQNASCPISCLGTVLDGSLSDICKTRAARRASHTVAMLPLCVATTWVSRTTGGADRQPNPGMTVFSLSWLALIRQTSLTIISKSVATRQT